MRSAVALSLERDPESGGRQRCLDACADRFCSINRTTPDWTPKSLIIVECDTKTAVRFSSRLYRVNHLAGVCRHTIFNAIETTTVPEDKHAPLRRLQT